MPEAKTYDNVLILGAGASVDAGLPTLSQLGDLISSLAQKKPTLLSRYDDLTAQDFELLERANSITKKVYRTGSNAARP
jgi:hypothetical protein